jgi:voltage-gated potassium channel
LLRLLLGNSEFFSVSNKTSGARLNDRVQTMVFFHQAAAAVALIALTFSLQCAGMAALIDWAKGHLERGINRLGRLRSALLMMRFTSLIIVLHFLEILLWAGFYRWKCLPSWEAAFYFSTTTYSTVGYGDLVLPPMWRTLGPIESVAGVLMCGLSASLLFAVVTRLVEREERLGPEPVPRRQSHSQN